MSLRISSVEEVAPKRPRHKRPGDVSAADVIHWIEKNCFIPEGAYVGQRVVLADWQKDCLRLIYDNPAGTRRAIISMARKNAKTTLSAFLLLLHLAGPKARPNSQLFSAAQSRDQAAIIFSLAAKIVRISPTLRGFITVRDSAKELACAELGTRYRALSAEVTTAFGLSPSMVIHDELGQVRGPRSSLYEALETATGAQRSPISVIISTQSPSDGDLLSILIDDALGGHDPKTVISLYTAPLELDPFDEATIKLANPALGNFLNREEVLDMAANARRMPAREAEYRNLVLNQRVEANSPFVRPAAWKACNGPVSIEDLKRVPIYAGLDLSEVADLTALVLIGKIGKMWHVQPTFWLPGEGLADKARSDRVPYDMWARQGFLQSAPGNAVSYEFVAQHLWKVFGEFDVVKLAFDRWNMKHLKPWLIAAGFSEQIIKDKFVEFGQGTQSMSPALRDLEQLILDGQLAHGDHPILKMCAMNAVVEGKDSANRKLSKNRSSGRIDGMVALAMACGVAPLKPQVIDVTALIG